MPGIIVWGEGGGAGGLQCNYRPGGGGSTQIEIWDLPFQDSHNTENRK